MCINATSLPACFGCCSTHKRVDDFPLPGRPANKSNIVPVDDLICKVYESIECWVAVENACIVRCIQPGIKQIWYIHEELHVVMRGGACSRHTCSQKKEMREPPVARAVNEMGSL